MDLKVEDNIRGLKGQTQKSNDKSHIFECTRLSNPKADQQRPPMADDNDNKKKKSTPLQPVEILTS